MRYSKKDRINLRKIEKDKLLSKKFYSLLAEGKNIKTALGIMFPKKEKAKDFYKSLSWRQLRYDVLKENNGRCCLCGRSAKDGVVLHVDHIIPLSVDWEKRLDKNNLQVLCEDCNMGKMNRDNTVWK